MNSAPPLAASDHFTLDPRLIAANGLNRAAFANRSAEDQAHAKTRLWGDDPKPAPFMQNAFARDLEKIQRSQAFARLDRIFQLAPSARPGSKNRQTHTQDTMLVSQSLCHALHLGADSEYLASAICAAHDIGHPPFAHLGERAIHQVLARYGIDWDHDQVAIQHLIDWPYTRDRHQGINPTHAVLEGVAKRYWCYAKPGEEAKPPFVQSYSRLPDSMRNARSLAAIHAHQMNGIEGQIAATSDWVAHTASDVSDALKEGWIKVDMVDQYFPGAKAVYQQHLTEWRVSARQWKSAALDQDGLQASLANAVADHVRNLLQVSVLNHTQSELLRLDAEGKLVHAEAVRDQEKPIVSFEPAMFARVRAFEGEVMHRHVYPALIQQISDQTPDGMNPQGMVEELLNDFIAGGAIPHLSADWQMRCNRLRSALEKAESPEARDAAEKDLVMAGVEYLARLVGDKDVLRYHNAKHGYETPKNWEATHQVPRNLKNLTRKKPSTFAERAKELEQMRDDERMPG